MITPAVLISACGTLIVSTSTRLGRLVDRVRELNTLVAHLSTQSPSGNNRAQRTEYARQLVAHARRGQLVQRGLAALYVALGCFVAAMVSIWLVGVVAVAAAFPSGFGVAGTLALLYGCLLLITEVRLALKSVNEEMQFVLHLPESHPSEQGD